MRIINRDRYVLRLPCGRLAALGALRTYTSNKTLNSRGIERYFSGTLGEDDFRLTPLISGRNAWLPVLRGTITEEADGTCRVEIDARPCWFTRLFMTIWYGGLGAMAVMLALSVKPPSIPALLLALLLALPIPGLMALFGFFLGHFAFWIPARKAKQTLLDIWNGEEM